MAKQKQTQENTEVENAQESVQQEEPNISIQDIMVARNIISAASTRGAFKAEELSTVGRLFDKFDGFVKYHAPETQKDDSESDTDSDKTDD